MIHHTAIIHPKAKLGAGVQVGPYSVIDGDVELGPGCILGPHVYITGVTKIGANNRFHAGAVIGDAPQDLKYKDTPTRLRIGDSNVFREHVTVHRSTKPDDETIVGSNNFIMASAHIAHNCLVGSHVILANGVLLAGHVEVHDRVFISGNSVVHQFCRVGTLAMMQGGSAATQDVPPFAMVQNGLNVLCGLNTIGLRRANISSPERMELRRLYKFLFRTGRNLQPALAEAKSKFSGPAVKTFLEFCAGAKRGVMSEPGSYEPPDED